MSRVATTPGPSFPLLVPTAASTWEGFVTVDDGAGRAHQFWVRLVLDSALSSDPQAPLAGATFTPDDHLAALLTDVLPLLHRRLQVSTSLASFLRDLQEAARAALDAQHSAGKSGDAARQLAFYTAVAADVAALPPGAVVDFSPTLDSLSLAHADAAGRTHLLRVRLPPDFPHSSPVVVAHDLPSDDLLLTAPVPGAAVPPPSTTATLAALLTALQRACARHGALWAALGVLDARCLVVDPPPAEGPPSGKARSRRLALDPALCGMGTTLLVELPQPPATTGNGGERGDGIGMLPPVVRLSGPEASVAPLRARIAASLAAWRPVGDAHALAQGTWLYDWLTSALGPPLPGRPADGAPGAGLGDEASTTVGLECGICYSVALPTGGGVAPGTDTAAGQHGANTAAVIVPDVWCDNPRCQRAYHTACLADWLREAGAQRPSFARFFGECPYCKAQISVLVPGEE